MIIRQINQGENEFSTMYPAAFNRLVVSPRADRAVQLVVDPCNIVLHLHSKNQYLHSISHIARRVIIPKKLLKDNKSIDVFVVDNFSLPAPSPS